MVVDTKIHNYVKKAVSYLPMKMRQEASEDLTEMIRDMVQDYAGSGEPDILDARAALKDLGRPEDIALSWLEAQDGRRKSTSYAAQWLSAHLQLLNSLSIERANHYLQLLTWVFSILAVALVGFGLLALGTHMIDTMLPIFIGCVLALGVVAGRGALARQSEF